MSDSEHSDSILETALHAHVSQRCQRAYVHELRNGLQGIYAGLDALSRIADGKAPAHMSVEKVRDLARKALQSHEQGINKTVAQLAPQVETQGEVNVGDALRELCAFLSNDAAAHDVIVNISSEQDWIAIVRPSRLRLSLLAVMVYSIDSMAGGGELNVTASSKDGRIEIGVELLSNDPRLADAAAWRFDADLRLEANRTRDWVLPALNAMLKKEGGAIESPLQEAPREARSYSNRRLLVLRFQARA